MQPMGQAEIKLWLKDRKNIENLFPGFISLHDVLAIGGQGVVFRGKVKNRDAAIKVYFPGQLQQRIDREVSALQSLSCDSVVKILWYGNINVFDIQLPVVATELINGTDLSALYKQRTISFDELGRIVYDISEAIDAMWNQRIVHRDIKPSNILIRDNGRACLIDLGVARHLDETSLTALGSTWGTLGYLSPEQAKSIRQLTCKSDIFALGVLIVECAIQRHPSQGDQLRLFALGLHQKLPEPLNSWEYSRYIRSMLNPEPMRRPKPGDLQIAFSNFRREDI
jgi:serine/threonine-protein kinase